MKVLIFSVCELPDNCAESTRIMNFAKLLQQAGHEVATLGVCDGNVQKAEGIYDSVHYQMFQYKPYFGWRAYKRIALLNEDIGTWLEQHSADKPFDVLLLSGVYCDYSGVFRKYARRTGAKLVIEVVEWYDKNAGQFRGIRGKINLIKNRIALRYSYVKMRNVLAISSLLDDYYKARGCNTVTIPTIVDLAQYDQVANQPRTYGDTIKIAYAGVPAQKDYVLNAIRALELLTEEERARLQLHFYGPTTEHLFALGLPEEFMQQYGQSIICHGRIPHAQVKNEIAGADFTVLLRPDKRYANAGFPTKVGESVACGTPVIANLTSDLHKYIIDGQTGIVCADETPESCAEAFRKALALTPEQREQLHKNCLEMAKKAFDYRAYVDTMDAFLTSRK